MSSPVPRPPASRPRSAPTGRSARAPARAALGPGAALAAAAAPAGCSDEEHYVVVTVTARPAVHGADRLRVTLANAGTMRTDELPLDDAAFPVTFSVSAPGRTGELGLALEAVDAQGLVVGRGAGATTLDADTASVLLDTTDFVVNTDYAGDQYPSDDYEAHGYQVSATDAGTWTVTFRDGCASPCSMFARRFDVTGRPVTTLAAASANAFPVSSELTSGSSTPAIASAGTATIALWDFNDPASTDTGVACRGLDAQGQLTPAQGVVATDPNTDVIAVAPMANSNYAVAWMGGSPTAIRTAIVRPDCTVLPAALPQTASTTASPRRPAVAASGLASAIMYAWVTAGAVRVRLASATNTLTGAADVELIAPTATERIEHVRLAPLPDGFAIVVRWALIAAADGPGRLELHRANLAGARVASPVLVSSRSGSDFASSEAFGVAASPTGLLMVVWHACGTSGDGSGCGVFGRAFEADGTPVGDELVIATTTTGDQTSPSVTALPGDAFAVTWSDASGEAPDVAGRAVRARIVYPRAP